MTPEKVGCSFCLNEAVLLIATNDTQVIAAKEIPVCVSCAVHFSNKVYRMALDW